MRSEVGGQRSEVGGLKLGGDWTDNIEIARPFRIKLKGLAVYNDSIFHAYSYC
jgi:hypothetical protein